MTDQTTVGHIIWHGLLTSDVERAREFYGHLMGWTYNVEHAMDFIWKSVEADYTLILAAGAAHGGVIEISSGQQSRWLAYVEVEDVDATTASAGSIGTAPGRWPRRLGKHHAFQYSTRGVVQRLMA